MDLRKVEGCRRVGLKRKNWLIGTVDKAGWFGNLAERKPPHGITMPAEPSLLSISIPRMGSGNYWIFFGNPCIHASEVEILL